MSPKTISKLIIWVTSVLIAWFSVTSFGMFILEEAIQSVGFGLYTLKDADSFKRIDALMKAERMKNDIIGFYAVLAVMNPISARWFNLYFEAVDFQFECYHLRYDS